jgi:hypothetical protein
MYCKGIVPEVCKEKKRKEKKKDILIFCYQIYHLWKVNDTWLSRYNYLLFFVKNGSLQSLSNTKRNLAVLLWRSDRCKLEQFEGPRHKGRFRKKVLVVRTDVYLDSWAFSQNITSSERMQGIRFPWLGICVESSWSITLNKKTLNNTEPLNKSIITWKWFCPTKCNQLQTNKTHWYHSSPYPLLSIWSSWYFACPSSFQKSHLYLRVHQGH